MDQAARDDARRLLALDGAPSKRIAPRRGAHDAGDRPVEGRFADAVRAEHGDDLARLDVEIDAAQHLGGAIAGGKAANASSGSAMRRTPRRMRAAAPWPR